MAHVTNFHANKTSNGVTITDGLKVRDYNMREGIVTDDETAASEIICCGHRDHTRDNDLSPGESCTDHYCNHDHWFTVTYSDGGNETDSFNGSRLFAI